MKRVFHIVQIGLLAAGLLPVAGCKKFVTVDQPQNTVTTTTLFSSETQAASALGGLYAQMVNTGNVWSNGGTDVYAGLSSDELVSRNGVQNPTDYAFESSQLTAVNTQPGASFWQPLYQDINVCNAIIEGTNASAPANLSDSARHQLIGEASFVRALSYFYLTNLFGDVPLVLSTDFNKTYLLGRSASDLVYNQIISDLKAAQGFLGSDFTISGGDRVRPTKWAATALLARVYLYRKNWKDAAAQATAVISCNLFGMPDLSKVFLKNSKESIWQLMPDLKKLPYAPNDFNNFLPTFQWSTMLPSDQAVALMPDFYGQFFNLVTPMYYLSPSAAAAFEPGDNRKYGWASYTPTPNAAPWTGDTLFWPNKYSRLITPAQFFTVLRLAEQYLIRAEAEAQLNDLTDGITDLNAVRGRTGLAPAAPASATDLLIAIAHERQVEFFGEWGHRFFDLKRTGQASKVLGALPAKAPWSDNQLLYPIPQTEILADPNLSQNTGY